MLVFVLGTASQLDSIGDIRENIRQDTVHELNLRVKLSTEDKSNNSLFASWRARGCVAKKATRGMQRVVLVIKSAYHGAAEFCDAKCSYRIVRCMEVSGIVAKCSSRVVIGRYGDLDYWFQGIHIGQLYLPTRRNSVMSGVG